MISEAGVSTAALLPGPAVTLRRCLRVWLAHRSPWYIGAGALCAWTARLYLGDWTWTDLAAGAALVALQPFDEWLIHTFVLHARPIRLGGHRIEIPLAREHRRHHEDPRDFHLIFVPSLDLAVLAAVYAVLLAALVPIRTALTAFAVSATLLLAYEWTHFLIHTPYRGRHRPYRTLARGHRLHHYRNEHYWMGITSPLGDLVLGTCPARSDVALSRTARTLAAVGSEDAAERT